MSMQALWKTLPKSSWKTKLHVPSTVGSSAGRTDETGYATSPQPVKENYNKGPQNTHEISNQAAHRLSVSILKSLCERIFDGKDTSNLSAKSGITDGKSCAACRKAISLLV